MPARAMRPPSPRSTRPSPPRPSTRNGGARGTDRNARSATTAAPQRAPPAINCICNRGNTESRNENVSRSMIRKSRNVSVSCRIPNLKCDSAIRSTVKASASAAQIAGRGSTDSNRQFTNAHASSDSVIANGPYSVDSRTASAARWIATITPAKRKEPDTARSCADAFARSGFGNADISSPQSPLMKPASISSRLNLRASAPSLQA